MKDDNQEIKNRIEDLNSEEREVLLKWAQKVREIQSNKELSYTQKLNKLKSLEHLPALKNLGILIKDKSQIAWKNASWSKRMAIIAGGGTLVTVGFAGSGIAALGGAIGVPLFLLTASGASLIGLIIDSLVKK